MEKAEQLTYQGIAPWMIWVFVLVGIAICVAIAAVWKVVQISRDEKKRKRDEIRSIAESIVKAETKSMADIVSKSVTNAMNEKFDAFGKMLDQDKKRIEKAEERSSEHDKALERIEQTLENVDKNIRDMSDGIAYITRGTIASLNHLRHNGNADELDEAARDLDKYLTHRPIVPIK